VTGRAGIVATRAIARWCKLRAIDITVEGGEHVPSSGPVLVAARHFHHLYDGAALIESIARPVRIFVALDWASSSLERFAMEAACRLARWPVALRGENLDASKSAFDKRELLQYTRRALEDAARLLREGEVLVVFPEGYPTIDPAGGRKIDADAFLPFRPGFLSIAARAARAGVRVPIVPAGFTYRKAQNGRWHVALRFGAPVVFEAVRDRGEFADAIAERVRALSSAA
jgi:putative membrane protein